MLAEDVGDYADDVRRVGRTFFPAMSPQDQAVLGFRLAGFPVGGGVEPRALVVTNRVRQGGLVVDAVELDVARELLGRVPSGSDPELPQLLEACEGVEVEEVVLDAGGEQVALRLATDAEWECFDGVMSCAGLDSDEWAWMRRAAGCDVELRLVGMDAVLVERSLVAEIAAAYLAETPDGVPFHFDAAWPLFRVDDNTTSALWRRQVARAFGLRVADLPSVCIQRQPNDDSSIFGDIDTWHIVTRGPPERWRRGPRLRGRYFDDWLNGE